MQEILTGTATANRYAFASAMGASNDAWLYFGPFAVHIVNSYDGVIVETLDRRADYDNGYSAASMNWHDAMGTVEDEAAVDALMCAVAPRMPLQGLLVADNEKEFLICGWQNSDPVSIEVLLGPVTVRLTCSREDVTATLMGLAGSEPARTSHELAEAFESYRGEGLALDAFRQLPTSQPRPSSVVYLNRKPHLLLPDSEGSLLHMGHFLQLGCASGATPPRLFDASKLKETSFGVFEMCGVDNCAFEFALDLRPGEQVPLSGMTMSALAL